MDLVVGIGDYAVSSRDTDRILTFALASCVAVTAYDQTKKVAGMLHIALPFPTDLVRSRSFPCYYATTGLPALMRTMNKNYGCRLSELRIGLYGGANSIHSDDLFHIGAKNIRAVCDTLESLSLQMRFTDLGGTHSRSLEMDVATGSIRVTTLPLTV